MQNSALNTDFKKTLSLRYTKKSIPYPILYVSTVVMFRRFFQNLSFAPILFWYALLLPFSFPPISASFIPFLSAAQQPLFWLGLLFIGGLLTYKSLPLPSIITPVCALILCALPDYAQIGLWAPAVFGAAWLLLLLRCMAYLKTQHPPAAISAFLMAYMLIHASYLIGWHWSVSGISTNPHTGLPQDHFHLPYGGWRLPLYIGTLIALFVYLKTRNKQNKTKPNTLIPILLFNSGVFIGYLAYCFFPHLIVKNTHISPSAAPLICLLSGATALFITLIAYYFLKKYPSVHRWLPALSALLFLLSLQPLSDAAVKDTMPLKKQELVDKKTENIKHKHYFSKSDKTKYLYTVRTTSRKQYYENGIILNSTISDTLIGTVPRLRLGALPKPVQEKILAFPQIRQLTLYLSIPMSLAALFGLSILLGLFSNSRSSQHTYLGYNIGIAGIMLFLYAPDDWFSEAVLQRYHLPFILIVTGLLSCGLAIKALTTKTRKELNTGE